MLIGRQVVIAPGDTEVLIDESEFDGPFTAVLRGSGVNVGGSNVTYQVGFPLIADLKLDRMVDSIYAANQNSAGNGSAVTVSVLAYTED